MSVKKTQPAALFSVAVHGHARSPTLQVAKILADRKVGCQQKIIGYASTPKGIDVKQPYFTPVPVSELRVQLVDGTERTLWMVGQSGPFLTRRPSYEPAAVLQSIH